MECLVETTVGFPVNTYLVHSGKLLAFKSFKNKSWKKFDTGLDFSKTGRTFKRIPIPAEFDEPQEKDVKIVIGSTGEKYFIKNGKCSCPGFRFRGKCKHVG